MGILTVRAVEAAKPGRTRIEIPDGTGTGLYLAVEPTGTKSWILRCRRNGASKRITLGRAGEDGLTLAAARHAAAAARHQIEQGAELVAPRLADPVNQDPGDRIEALVASFLELHAYRKTRESTARATERAFNRLVLPAWRGRSIHDIRRRDVIDLIEGIATDRPYQANRTREVLSKFFNWLCARDLIAASPVTGVERPHKEVPRSRTLSDSEIRALWLAGEGDGPFGQALQLLILTGARRNEVSRLQWSEIDADRRLWLLPRERAKNAREHAIPLSPPAWKIIQAMPRITGCPYVFSADGRRPITGWAKAKTRISAKAGLDEKDWRLHDIRRGVAAGLQRLGVPVAIVEKALNHQSGVFRGIVSTYQTHDYADEVRVALQRWGEHVEALITGKPAKVVPLRGRRR